MLEGGLGEVEAIDDGHARHRLPDGSVRADRRDRRRRQPRGQPDASSRPSSATRATGRTRCSGRVVEAGRLGRKSDGGCYDYGPDGARGAPWPASSRAGRRTRGASARRGPDRGPDPGRDRERGGVGGRRWRRLARGDRHGHAPGDELAGGPAGLGRADRPGSVVHTLDALHASVPDGRYRGTPLLRVLAERGGLFFNARS